MPNKKIQVRADYDPRTISGVAQLNDRQIESLNFNQNSARLRKDLTYVIPAQKAHLGKVKVNNGEDRDSIRIFAIGLDKDNKALVATTLSINTLRARHYGFVADGALHIPVAQDPTKDNLWRIPSGTASQKSVWLNGSAHVTVSGKLAIVDRPVAFRVIDRTDVFQPQFKETTPGSGKYDIAHINNDGQEEADLQKVTVNIYDEVLNVPQVNPVDCIEDFEKYAYTAE